MFWGSNRRVNWKKLYDKTQNNPKDVRFSDFLRLIEFFGFTLDRQSGSHRIYKNPHVYRLLNIQPRKDGKAKPAQVREFLEMVNRHGLYPEDEQ